MNIRNNLIPHILKKGHTQYVPFSNYTYMLNSQHHDFGVVHSFTR